jgi:hypothetical protein
LIGALALCALVYAAFFLESPFKTRDIVILRRPAPRWNSVVFGLDEGYAVTGIEVVALTPDGSPARTVWKLRGGRETPDISAFAYGQSLPGMEARVQPSPLHEGERYRLIVRAPGARGEAEFEYVEGDATIGRRRRGG